MSDINLVVSFFWLGWLVGMVTVVVFLLLVGRLIERTKKSTKAMSDDEFYKRLESLKEIVTSLQKREPKKTAQIVSMEEIRRRAKEKEDES